MKPWSLLVEEAIQSATHLRCIGDPAVKYDWNPQSRPAHITNALETKAPSTKEP